MGDKNRNYDDQMDILFFCFLDLHFHLEDVVYQPNISVLYALMPNIFAFQLAVFF